MRTGERALVVVSGGMDSVTLAYLLDSEGYELHLLSVDYRQRHNREIEYARHCSERLGATFDVADISQVGRLLSGSALTDDIEVPHSHYAAENMAVTGFAPKFDPAPKLQAVIRNGTGCCTPSL
jgi:7-cyano-7-deazaguanine synthase